MNINKANWIKQQVEEIDTEGNKIVSIIGNYETLPCWIYRESAIGETLKPVIVCTCNKQQECGVQKNGVVKAYKCECGKINEDVTLIDWVNKIVK